MKAKILVPSLIAIAALVVVIGTTAAGLPHPFRSVAMMYSSDGSGAPNTFAYATGSGGTSVGFVPDPAAMMYSSDGSGNPGTFAYCGPSCFGGGSGPASTVPGWLQYLGDGSDGALNVTSGSTNLNGEHWYSSVNISSGATVALNTGEPGLIIRSTGACTIAGTLSVSANTGGGGVTTTSNYGGGGGGGGGGTAAGAAGSSAGLFGGGGTAGVSSGGTGGTASAPAANGYRIAISGFGMNFSSNLASGTLVAYGGAPGGTGGTGAAVGGKGGNAVVLICASLVFTGTIDASGQAGGNSAANNNGGGGGGGGGFIIVRSPSVTTNTGTINVAGGTGGTCGAFTGCGVGGAGGAGWSKVFTN